MNGNDKNENILKYDAVLEEVEKKSSLSVVATTVDEEENHCQPVTCPHDCQETDLIPNSSDHTSPSSNENIELEEKEDGFIGPRLPRVMTDQEFKALMDKLLGDKYK